MTVQCYRPLCVLGAVENERGREIADEMMRWLVWHYDLHVVWHDGTLYEQPALRYAQQLSLLTRQPVLYLHTKGAYNKPELSRQIRRMWRKEFGAMPNRYFRAVSGDIPAVACPLTGADRMTRYDGFVANPAAWYAIPLIVPSADRMTFEKLWQNYPDVRIYGLVNDKITSATLREAHAIINQY